MKYRTLGRTGWSVSEIGLGTEYLLDQPSAVMDEVMQTATAAGVNFVDLLYNGPRFWNNFTPVIKQYRDKVRVAVHWGVGEFNGQLENVREQDVCQRFFDATMANLGNDYADVAMLMMVDRMELWDSWAQASLERLIRLKEQGRIGAIGMSSHKAAPALKAINSGQIDVLMYPVNLASHAIAGNNDVLDACVQQNVGLVAMKPYAGGAFFQGEQSLVLYWFRSGGSCLQVQKHSPISPAQCLSYVLAQPVATIVPGVKSARELEGALRYYDATDDEKDYSHAIASVTSYPADQCIYCNHCLPCPQGIDIGQTIRLVDTARDGMTDKLKADYVLLPARASDCIECGDCLERCPYEVNVPGKMRSAVRLFEDQNYVLYQSRPSTRKDDCMKLELLPTHSTAGKIFCHNIDDGKGGKAFAKGHLIQPGDIARLQELGHDSVYVVTLDEHDVHEDAAATRLALAVKGSGVEVTKATSGRVNLLAVQRGVVTLNVQALESVNGSDGLTVAVLREHSVVEAGKIVATVKIIPYAVNEKDLRFAEDVGQLAEGIVSVLPILPGKVAIILTASETAHEHVVANFEAPLRQRVTALGCHPLPTVVVAEQPATIARAISDALQQHVSVIIIAGQTSIMDSNDITPQGIRLAGGKIECFGAPVEPGNLLLLASVRGTPVLGAPGCARSRQTNVIDLVLPRLLAGELLAQRDIRALGNGGLL